MIESSYILKGSWFRYSKVHIQRSVFTRSKIFTRVATKIKTNENETYYFV